MKGKILAIIFLLNFTSYLALNAQWAKTYGGSEDDRVSSILQTSDGGYIVVGNTYSLVMYDFYSDFGIVKLNMLGDIEWQNTYTGGDSIAEPSSILQTNEGGYIIGGTIHSQFGIMKLSVDGDIEWQKIYGYEFNVSANSLLPTSDGGYIVAGGNWISGTHDIIILKLSFDGIVEWTKTYGESTIDDQAYIIQQTNDGGYIAVGQTYVSGTGSFDILILKLASDGSIEWQRTYGGIDDDYAYSIQQTNDGGYIAAGSISSFGAGLFDFWVLKLSSGGDIVWDKTYGGSESETAHSIQQTFDGGYVVIGTTRSFGGGKGDFWILKLDILGVLEWQKTYGGSKDEEAKSIQQTVDGGYIVVGDTNTYGAGERDFLILKLFPNGDINSSCGLMNESNAEVSDTGIIPANTDLNPEDIVLASGDASNTQQESNAVVYSLCSGPHSLSLTASSGGTTIPQPGIHIYDHAERISLSTNPDEGYNFIGWSGDVSSTDSLLYITMDSDKSVKANFSENILEEIWEEVKKAPCFIATATFGSRFHPFVKALQDFRDKYLMSSRSGRKIVNLYYKYSPHIAELITNHKASRTIVRIWLMPFVAVGYSMVHFGPVKTTIMLVLTSLPLFFFVWFYRRRDKRMLISILIFVLFSNQIYGQTDYSKNSDQAQLESILKKCAEYCERLEKVSLYFVCEEAITEEIFQRNRSWPGVEKNKYIYDYQLVRQGDTINEQRILIKENSQKKNIKNAQLKTKRFHHKYIVFGPIGLLGQKQQEINEYKILKEEIYKKEKVVILEASPKYPDEFNALYGKIWIRKRDFNILKIEWEQESLENFEGIEEIAKRLHAIPKITFVSEYAFEKNEIRFPSKYSVEENYILPQGTKYHRSRIKVIYDNYKFFIVDTKVKY